MEIRPAAARKNPGYPTKLQTASNPSLLEKNIPEAWRRSAAIAGMLSLLLSSPGCRKSETPTPGPKAAFAAPIFPHGEGRGFVGCQAINPPAFLSEEEAYGIITEEMAKASVQLSRSCAQFSPVAVALCDSARYVAVDYVSAACCEPEGRCRCPEMVESRRKTAQEQGRAMFYGVLYDPLVHPQIFEVGNIRARQRMDRVRVREERKELLRLQITDFIQWLKGQGVI
jgi:hypothetical protein